MRLYHSVLAAACASALTACGGTSTPADHAATAKGIITCKPAAAHPRCGSPCNVWFYDDGSSSLEGPIVKWEWKFNTGHGGGGGGGWFDATATRGLVMQGCPRPGTFTATCRLTDALGNTGTEKVSVDVRGGADAEPACFVADASSSSRYHEWRWLLHDPDSPDFDGHLAECIIEADLDGDGEFEPLLRLTGDPATDPKVCDLDGDGAPESFIVDAQGPIITIQCPRKAKEDVYVWKIKTRESGKLKEYTGHVTILK
jgi:hypothetical protein